MVAHFPQGSKPRREKRAAAGGRAAPGPIHPPAAEGVAGRPSSQLAFCTNSIAIFYVFVNPLRLPCIFFCTSVFPLLIVQNNSASNLFQIICFMLYSLLFTALIQNVSGRQNPIVTFCTKISAFRFVKLMESQSFPFVHNFAPIRSSFWQIFNRRKNFANSL